MPIITIGIDLSKNFFAVHGVNENERVASSNLKTQQRYSSSIVLLATETTQLIADFLKSLENRISNIEAVRTTFK